MALYEEWKKEAQAKVGSKDGFPACPRCKAHDYEFDSRTGRFSCKKCNFETYLKVI